MASYGMLDFDLTYWQQPIVFNLELMKLANYYRQQRHLVKMSHAAEFERFSKIFIRKDYDDNVYPSGIFTHPKAEVGGLAFSGGVYQPLPIEIEKTPPDTSLYENMSRYYQSTKAARQRYKTFLSAAHFRLSLDGKTIWPDWECQLRHMPSNQLFSLIVHDFNVHNIENSVEVLKSIRHRFHPLGRRFGFKFPIDIYEEEDFLKWSQLLRLRYTSKMRLHKIFEDLIFEEIVTNTGHMSCEYVLNKDDLTNENIVKIFKQAVFLGEHRSELLLYITNENEIIDSNLLQLLKILREYFAYLYKRGLKSSELFSMYLFARYSSQWLKVDLINLFEYVRKTNYELFKLFYECSSIEVMNQKFESRYIWKPT